MHNLKIGRVLLKSFIVAVTGFILVFSAGCRTRTTSAGMMMESYPGNRVKLNSRVFGDWFMIVGSAVSRTPSGLLRVTVSLENLQERDCAVEYRYRWIDADGIEITSGTTIWQQHGVSARETALLSGIAPTKSAEDFILDVRFVRDSTRWRR